MRNKACKHCKSTNVVANATIIWDYVKQQYIINDIDEKNVWCYTCDRPTTIINSYSTYNKMESALLEIQSLNINAVDKDKIMAAMSIIDKYKTSKDLWNIVQRGSEIHLMNIFTPYSMNSADKKELKELNVSWRESSEAYIYNRHKVSLRN